MWTLGNWVTVICSCVRYELTCMSRLNSTDGVLDVSYVAANVLMRPHVAYCCIDLGYVVSITLYEFCC